MTTSADDPCCKVGRNIQRYELEGLNDELRERREGADASLRALADHVNERILSVAMNRASVNVVGDAASVYEVLTGEDVDPGRRADVRDQLLFAEVDLETVTDDFVSHQTIKTHLTDCLDIDTSRTGVESLSEAREVIEWARSRDEEIIEKTLARLRRIDELETGDLDVTHSISVHCEDCGAVYRMEELLDGGHCKCATSK